MNQDDSRAIAPQVSIPDIRDYDRVNAELIELLHKGHPRVRLVGAEGQRFLASGLTGAWNAIVEVEGRAGPELAAGLNAPGLSVVCHGPAADGAGRGLRKGRLVVLGDVGDGLAYAQEGGTILATSNAGHRAGLNQKGGVLLVLGRLGRLAGERQAGGALFVFEERLGPHPGLSRRGGRFVRLNKETTLEPQDLEILRTAVLELSPWSVDFEALLPTGQIRLS